MNRAVTCDTTTHFGLDWLTEPFLRQMAPRHALTLPQSYPGILLAFEITFADCVCRPVNVHPLLSPPQFKTPNPRDSITYHTSVGSCSGLVPSRVVIIVNIGYVETRTFARRHEIIVAFSYVLYH